MTAPTITGGVADMNTTEQPKLKCPKCREPIGDDDGRWVHDEPTVGLHGSPWCRDDGSEVHGGLDDQAEPELLDFTVNITLHFEAATAEDAAAQASVLACTSDGWLSAEVVHPDGTRTTRCL